MITCDNYRYFRYTYYTKDKINDHQNYFQRPNHYRWFFSDLQNVIERFKRRCAILALFSVSVHTVAAYLATRLFRRKLLLAVTLKFTVTSIKYMPIS